MGEFSISEFSKRVYSVPWRTLQVLWTLKGSTWATAPLSPYGLAYCAVPLTLEPVSAKLQSTPCIVFSVWMFEIQFLHTGRGKHSSTVVNTQNSLFFYYYLLIIVLFSIQTTVDLLLPYHVYKEIQHFREYIKTWHWKINGLNKLMGNVKYFLKTHFVKKSLLSYLSYIYLYCSTVLSSYIMFLNHFFIKVFSRNKTFIFTFVIALIIILLFSYNLCCFII